MYRVNKQADVIQRVEITPNQRSSPTVQIQQRTQEISAHQTVYLQQRVTNYHLLLF